MTDIMPATLHGMHVFRPSQGLSGIDPSIAAAATEAEDAEADTSGDSRADANDGRQNESCEPSVQLDTSQPNSVSFFFSD